MQNSRKLNGSIYSCRNRENRMKEEKMNQKKKKDLKIAFAELGKIELLKVMQTKFLLLYC